MTRALLAFALTGCLHIDPCNAESRWQIVECQPNLPCRFRGASLSSETACQLDVASLAVVVPSGTRITCKRVEAVQ